MSTSRAPRRVVLKFGGSSVATVDKLRSVARQVVARKRAGWDVVVVVSAMGASTDHLLAQARAVAGEPDRRELDMLLSVGERIAMALLAMAIRDAGLEAVSLTGSQSGIITTASHAQARIMEVRPFRVEDELEAGRVVIVAGYQGVSYAREITTLGRGGSDTTAVALAAALEAEACEIYSDVDGVYTADPRLVPAAQRLDALGHEEMQELAEAGARVLNAQAVEFAKDAGIAIYARETGSDAAGTVIRRNAPRPSSGVRGLAHQPRVLAASARDVAPARAEALLEALAELGAEPRGYRHDPGPSGAGPLGFVLALEDLHAPDSARRAIEAHLGPSSARDDLGALALVGTGIGRRPDLLVRATRAAGEVLGVSTSSFRVSLLVPALQLSAAARRLHAALGLDAPEHLAR